MKKILLGLTLLALVGCGSKKEIKEEFLGTYIKDRGTYNVWDSKKDVVHETYKATLIKKNGRYELTYKNFDGHFTASMKIKEVLVDDNDYAYTLKNKYRYEFEDMKIEGTGSTYNEFKVDEYIVIYDDVALTEDNFDEKTKEWRIKGNEVVDLLNIMGATFRKID